VTGSGTSELRELLFGWPHDGLRRAGHADPFSGFLLVGARIDALASLAYPSEPDDRRTGKRYSRFVTEFFSTRYRDLGLGPLMWDDLRSAPLHFLSSSGRLALADSQPEANIHLAADEHGRLILHWPELLEDYEHARDRFWERIEHNHEMRAHALAALAQRPPLRVQQISPGLALPIRLPVTFPAGGASAYGGAPPSTRQQ
jgi:hypothetical protein